MRSKRGIIMMVAAASLCAVVFAAMAADAPPGGPRHARTETGRIIGVLVHATDLTADQQARVRQILDNRRAATSDTVAALRQATTELASLMLGADPVAPEAVSTQLTQIAQLRQQLAQQNVASALAIRVILTPEQLAKAAAAKQDMGMRHQGHPCPDVGT